MKKILISLRNFIFLILIGFILCPILPIQSEEFLDDEVLLIPSTYSENLITDNFDDGNIDEKWITYSNLYNNDSIMFINASKEDTEFVLQQGNAYLYEGAGVLSLVDPINIEQYRELINDGYERYTRMDYDYAGLRRDFIGIDFDSLYFRFKNFQYESVEDSTFMSGHNYLNIFFMDKSEIQTNIMLMHCYQIKMEIGADKRHYNFIFRYFLYTYDCSGNLISKTEEYRKTISYVNKTFVDKQEYIDFKFIKQLSDSMEMIAIIDTIIYSGSTTFKNSDCFLSRIDNHICPYNPDSYAPYDTIFIPGYVKIDYIKYFEDETNADSSWLIVEHPNVLYACVDTLFDIIVKDGKRNNWPVEGATVIISDSTGTIFEGITGYEGVCHVSEFNYPEVAELTIEVRKDSEFFRPYHGTINVVEKYVLDYPEEMKVIDYENVTVQLKMWDDFIWDTVKAEYIPQRLIPVPDAEINLINNYDLSEVRPTDSNGIAQFDYIQTYCTKYVAIEAIYGNYHDTGLILPYMWSYTNEATGPNNANHIIRNDQTGELFMTYTQHNPYPDPFVPTRINRVIGAYSDNDGEYWYLDDMGYGLNASVDLDIEGNPELFYDRVTGYYYNTFMLPTPSVVTNGSMWVAPGSMWHDSVNGLVNTAGIKYVDTEDKPYLVNAVFDANDPLNADVEVVIDYHGLTAGNDASYSVVPFTNPSIALAYNSDSHLNDRLIAFEDKNSEICQIRYNSLVPRWDAPERKSFSLDLKSVNPHMDAFYSNASLVWQEESAPGADDYRIYLNDSRFFGDNTETNKQFPKVKRNQYISCVDNTNTAKLWYFKDSYLRELDIAVSTEGIYYPDFDIKTTAIPPIRTRHTAYYVYTEQNGDIYKIKTGNIAFTTNDIIQPLDNIVLSDTTEVTNTSPIYNYIPSLSRPVDRISSTVTGLDYTKYYELKVNTTNNNKNEPYILMIDGNVTEVIYGKENELFVPVDAEYLSDREITVSVDIVKGNPHRTVDIEIYQYDEVEGEGTGTIVQNNTLPFKANEAESTVFSVVNKGIGINGAFEMEINLPNDDIVKVRVYDIMGREVNVMDKELRQGYNALSVPVTDRQNNPLSKGVYFIKIQSRDNTYSGKLVNIK